MCFVSWLETRNQGIEDASICRRRCVDRGARGYRARTRGEAGRGTDAELAAAVADDSRARHERDAGVRRLVLRQGRQHPPARGVLQPEHETGIRHPRRTEQPHRARRSRSGTTDAFPDRPPMGRARDQSAEGVRPEEADVDDRRERIHQQHHAPHAGRLRRRAVRRRGEQEHAAEDHVPAGRSRVHRSADRHGRLVHDRGQHTTGAHDVGDGRRTEDQRPRNDRPWSRTRTRAWNR